MSEWLLFDCKPMVETLDELPRIAIDSDEQLREELNRYRYRVPPSIIELVSPDGEILSMGIGREWSGMHWMKEPVKDHCKTAVADRPYVEAGMEFVFQGTTSGFRRQFVLPVEQTIEAAVHFFKTGKLPEWLQWGTFNPQTKRFEVSPAVPANGAQSSVPHEDVAGRPSS